MTELSAKNLSAQVIQTQRKWTRLNLDLAAVRMRENIMGRKKYLWSQAKFPQNLSECFTERTVTLTGVLMCAI